MTNVAVIPARGGSKRIPRKNIREFSGKPIIAHSIEAALKSDLFDRVIVSTDDEEIAKVAQQYGAEVPFLRPEELANDYAGTTEVMTHAVKWLQEHGENPLAMCCIYATAPFIQEEDLRKGLDLLMDGDWNYVFSATQYAFPIFRGFKKLSNHGLDMCFPEHFGSRSQDLPDVMHDAGQFYWGLPEAWHAELKLFESWSTVVELPTWRVQDIDTLDDWNRAQIIHQMIEAMMVDGNKIQGE